jgi:subtilisin
MRLVCRPSPRLRLSLVASVVALSVLALAGGAYGGGRDAVPQRTIVVLEEGASIRAVLADYGVRPSHVYRHALRGFAAPLEAGTRHALAGDSRVAYVSADGEVHAVAQTLPTGINRIDGETSSTASGNGTGAVSNVAVAVIDTGIDVDHPDLNVAGGKNCSTGKSFDDGNGHGTHVAGTIAAKDDANGVAGVAPGAPVYAVRVLNNAGSGSWSSVICGVDWVTANAASKGVKVANMSLGGSGSDGSCGSHALHQAICNSVAAGVTYVVAAGNSSADFKNFVPAAYDQVLSVTAVADFNGLPGGGASPTCRSDVDETFADFSNFATLVSDQNHAIAAPGVCIESTWKGGGYRTISGTSMASPHTAGTAALCISTGACTGTPATIMQKLRDDAAAYNSGDTGYGFEGDPLHPVSGKYFGYLLRAGGY